MHVHTDVAAIIVSLIAVRLARVAFETAAAKVRKQDLIAVVADEEGAATCALDPMGLRRSTGLHVRVRVGQLVRPGLG